MNNRRQFTRILFSIQSTLIVKGQRFNAILHDISLNGALIYLDTKGITLTKQPGLFSFQLAEANETITMNVSVVHQEGNDVGIKCNDIDIDSVCLLRRLVELNIGDGDQLHKELSQLTKAEAY